VAQEKDPLPKISPPVTLPAENSDADKEASLLATNTDLKTDAERRDHGRKEGLRDSVARALTVFIYLFLFAFIIAGSIVFWHFSTPESRHWLTALQVDKLETMLGSALVAVLFSRAVERNLH
jgi:hypothetical protein